MVEWCSVLSGVMVVVDIFLSVYFNLFIYFFFLLFFWEGSRLDAMGVEHWKHCSYSLGCAGLALVFKMFVARLVSTISIACSFIRCMNLSC
ncbi:hypothetical protein F9C07_1185084 [Aspergillus flavus]|uniref:Uncharacterized protein n=1 Tax=Aspergillus flavus (strain ATCC 200026 / FGSC A1120 / IAM 13836 / NRRL 3357 / JCM 12722 / SRRC 167) TaxID=332952 RepID=A0A7U2MD65_ASPFN|nr:hypothetical protein F9C07_1185084 [Aspergillus flavus]